MLFPRSCTLLQAHLKRARIEIGFRRAVEVLRKIDICLEFYSSFSQSTRYINRLTLGLLSPAKRCADTCPLNVFSPHTLWQVQNTDNLLVCRVFVEIPQQRSNTRSGLRSHSCQLGYRYRIFSHQGYLKKIKHLSQSIVGFVVASLQSTGSPTRCDDEEVVKDNFQLAAPCWRGTLELNGNNREDKGELMMNLQCWSTVFQTEAKREWGVTTVKFRQCY